MPNHRVLLVGEMGRFPADLPETIDRDSAGTVQAEAFTALQDAMARMAETGFDAAVCAVERQEELAAVIKIRKARPDLPILVLTNQTDRGFSSLARQMGATKVAHNHPDLAVVSKMIWMAVQTGELAKEVNARAEQVYRKAGDLAVLAKETYERARSTWNDARKSSHLGFVPLIIEDDREQGTLMLQALGRLGIPTLLPVLRSGLEVQAYFSKAPPFENCGRYPTPTVVLLDGDLGDMSGVDALRWLRKHPGLGRIPVIMLSSSSNPEQVSRSYEAGANSYLQKPANLEGFVDLLSQIRLHWGTATPPR